MLIKNLNFKFSYVLFTILSSTIILNTYSKNAVGYYDASTTHRYSKNAVGYYGATDNAYTVSCSKRNIKAIKKSMQSIVSKWQQGTKIPSIAVSVNLPCANGDYRIVTAVSGTTKIDGAGKPINSSNTRNSTLYQVGSTTKSFTAAIILQLEAEGKLKLSDKLTHYLPQYDNQKYWKKITIKQLLNMTSGIPNYGDHFGDQIKKDPTKQWTNTELVALILNLDPKSKIDPHFKPGKGYSYSNTNYALLAMIIKKITGNNVTQEMNQRFLHKNNTSQLNLKSTIYYDHAYSNKILKRLAIPYSPDNKSAVNINPSQMGAAGAMLSNSDNLSRWAREFFETNQYNTFILQPEQYKQMHSWVYIDTKDQCAGMNPNKNKKAGQPVPATDKISEATGLGVDRIYLKPYQQIWFHTGSSGASQALFAWLKNYNITIAITVNQTWHPTTKKDQHGFNPFRVVYPCKNSIMDQVVSSVLKVSASAN